MDKLNLYLIAIIFPYAALNFHWMFWLSGAVLGFGVPLLVTWLFYKIRGQIGLGGGDIKLFGILGLILGPIGVFFTILISCFVGAVLGLALTATGKMSKEKPMSVGPAIILVASFQIFFPESALVVQSWSF